MSWTDSCDKNSHSLVLSSCRAIDESLEPMCCWLYILDLFLFVLTARRKFLRELNVWVFSLFNVAVPLRSCTQIHARTAIHFTYEDIETFEPFPRRT